MHDNLITSGTVQWELRGPDGELKGSGVEHNIITEAGDNMYATRGITADAGIAAAPDAPTGMKLGTGATTGGTAPAKTVASGGAVLAAYLTNSHQTFDATPTIITETGVQRIRYICTFAAGKANSVGVPITEAVIVNQTTPLADANAPVGNVMSRVALSNIGGKGAADTLTITWDHRIGSV